MKDVFKHIVMQASFFISTTYVPEAMCRMNSLPHRPHQGNKLIGHGGVFAELSCKLACQLLTLWGFVARFKTAKFYRKTVDLVCPQGNSNPCSIPAHWP
jgi:hypothetical protein